jgi:hypothetical protein
VDIYDLRPSPAVSAFLERFADGQEYLAFSYFFRRLLQEPGGTGKREFAHHGPRRTIHFSYYVSGDLRTIFVMMAYQERPGEPRERDLAAEAEFLSAIQKLEKHHGQDT